MHAFSGMLMLLLLVATLTIAAPVSSSMLQPTPISPTGPTGKIVFTGESDEAWSEIYLIDIGRTEIHAITDVGNASGPSLSPDKKHVIFSDIDDNGWNVYSVDIDGSNLRALTVDDAVFPTWSPDGKSIAFISIRDGRPRLYVMDADGSNERRLADIDISDRFYPAPVWSPDSQRIAVVSSLLEVYVVDVSDFQVFLISPSGYGPNWSPDGTKIILSKLRASISTQVLITNPDGSEPQDLSSGYVHDMLDPAWSPDGRHIAFMSSDWQTASLYVMNTDGSNKRFLVDAESRLGPPIWSPDGEYIAFPTICDGSEQIYIVHMESSVGFCLATGGIRVHQEAVIWLP
jgi:TolB protein